jgi:hypothetical protein
MTARVAIDDGGAVIDNGGAVIDNGGVVIDNGGVVIDNGGVVVDNGGVVIDNGRAAIDDGRAAIDDGRVAIDDGGVAIGGVPRPLPDRLSGAGDRRTRGSARIVDGAVRGGDSVILSEAKDLKLRRPSYVEMLRRLRGSA